MKNIVKKLRKGFTIVELVIVIAVIAILAAVLIPTLANVIDSAEESNDMVLVSDLNKIVAAYDTVGEIDKVTMSDGTTKVYNVTTALTAADENGYDVSKLTPTSEKGDIVYNASTNRFIYYTDNFAKLAYGDEPSDNAVLIVIDSNLSRVGVAEAQGITVQYCVYTTYDTGANIDNSNITVWLYTEGGSVTINLADGTVYHYGEAEAVTIKEVATESYHLYGKVEEITLEKGHVELAESSVCGTVTASDNSETKSLTVVGTKTFKLKGSFTTLSTKTSDTATSTTLSEEEFATATGAALEGTEANPYEIESLTALNEKITSDCYVTLTKDIECSTAIAINKNVTIDLNGHTISAAYKSTYGSACNTITVGYSDTSASLTIKDSSGGNGSIVNSATKVYASIATKGTLILESGTIEANYRGISLLNGNVTINGGTVKVSDDSTVVANAIYLAGVSGCTGLSLTINGGNIMGGTYIDEKTNSAAIATSNSYVSTININGGNISGKYGVYFNADENNVASSITMTGGSIKTTSVGITVVAYGTATIQGGEIYGGTHGILLASAASTSNVTTEGGTITGGVYSQAD